MALMERLLRLARSNANVLLDLGDDPVRVVDDGLDELDQAVEEAKQAVAAYSVAHGELEQQLAEATGEGETCRSRAEAAVAAGQDDAARQALAGRLRCADRLERLTPECRRSGETLSRLRDNLNRLTEQRDATRRKVSELCSRRRAAEAQQAFHARSAQVGLVGEQKVVQQLRDKVAEAEAEATVAERTALPDLDLEALSEAVRVELELERLKAGSDDAGANPQAVTAVKEPLPE